MLVELFLCGIIALVAKYIIGRLYMRGNPLEGIPGPRPYPVVGNIFEMLQAESADLFLQWKRIYGSIVKYQVFLLGTQVMVIGADEIRHIFVTNSSNYKKPENLLIPVRKIFGRRCLIALPQDEHDIRRKMLCPAFNPLSIKTKVSKIQEHVHRLLALWKKERVVGVQTDLKRLSLDLLGDCMFGYEFNSINNPHNVLAAALDRVASVKNMNILRFLPFYKYLPTQLNKDTEQIRYLILELMRDKMKRDSSSHTNTDSTTTDMLDLMLKGRGDSFDDIESTCSPAAMTDNDVIDDMLLFLIAGHETVTNSLCWTLLELARHPSIQEKCRFEIASVARGRQYISYDDCDRLKFTECCIKESMRLYPPVPLTCRETIRDDYLGGFTIPAGTTVALQIGAMMRCEDYFSQPSEFIPDRFLEKTYGAEFSPFLLGRDMCIGSKFAMLEMKLILSVLLLNTQFTLPNDGTQFKGAQGLTYHIKPPLYLHKRNV